MRESYAHVIAPGGIRDADAEPFAEQPGGVRHCGPESCGVRPSEYQRPIRRKSEGQQLQIVQPQQPNETVPGGVCAQVQAFIFHRGDKHSLAPEAMLVSALEQGRSGQYDTETRVGVKVQFDVWLSALREMEMMTMTTQI